jgi:outer membrane protein
MVVDQISDIYQYATNNQPEIKAAELRSQSAQKGLAFAKGGYLPTLGYSANINSTYSDRFIEVIGLENNGTQPIGFLATDPTQIILAPNFRPITQTTPFGTQFRNNLGQQFSVFLSIPILNGGQNSTNVQRAKISINQAKLNLDQNKNTLYQNVSQAYVDYQTSLTRNNANEANLEAQKENYEFAKIRFEQGAINSIDFGNIRTAYETSISTQLQNKYELIFRSKVIDFYLGKPIKL